MKKGTIFWLCFILFFLGSVSVSAFGQQQEPLPVLAKDVVWVPWSHSGVDPYIKGGVSTRQELAEKLKNKKFVAFFLLLFVSTMLWLLLI